MLRSECKHARALKGRSSWRVATLAGCLGAQACASGDDAIDDETPLDEPGSGQEGQWGSTLDWEDVEAYDGTVGPSVAFVDSHQGPVGIIEFNNGAAPCTG